MKIIPKNIYFIVAPIIVPFPLGDKPSHTDQFLSLSCVISDGDLPLNIFWTFNNNQPITSDMDVTILKLGKRSSVLTIDSVGGHHAGNYTCHGQNLAGSISYTTELKVIGVFVRLKKKKIQILFFDCVFLVSSYTYNITTSYMQMILNFFEFLKPFFFLFWFLKAISFIHFI